MFVNVHNEILDICDYIWLFAINWLQHIVLRKQNIGGWSDSDYKEMNVCTAKTGVLLKINVPDYQRFIPAVNVYYI